MYTHTFIFQKQYGCKTNKVHSIPAHLNLIKEFCLNKNMLTKNVFDQIYVNRNFVCFPANWCRLILGNNKTVIFWKILLREDNFKPYFERPVCINE